MEYTVSAVSDRRTMNDFMRLPSRIYGRDERWVAPIASEVRRTLDRDRNPYFLDASLDQFVCYADRRPVARMAVIVNRKYWTPGTGTTDETDSNGVKNVTEEGGVIEDGGSRETSVRPAFFGFFESLDDREAVCKLFEHAAAVVRGYGADILEGPFNPNHYSELGMQVSGFGTAPAFFQPFNPPYYPALLEAAGLRVSKTIHTRKNAHIRSYLQRRYGEVRAPERSGPYTVRSFRMDDLASDLERVREVFNDAFASNWRFLPLTKREYEFSAQYLHLVTRPELITIVEHEGEPVGVLECVLDVNPLLKKLHGRIGPLKFVRYLREKKRVKSLIIYAVGIKKGHQGGRVFKLLLDSVCAQAAAYESIETTWMTQDNLLALRAAEHLGLERDKEFAIYRTRVNGSSS